MSGDDEAATAAVAAQVTVPQPAPDVMTDSVHAHVGSMRESEEEKTTAASSPQPPASSPPFTPFTPPRPPAGSSGVSSGAYPHSAHAAAGGHLQHLFTPPTIRSMAPPYSAAPASSASWSASSTLPPFASSFASLPPASVPATPAKVRLNHYLVELVKNSIRITDDFSAMCRAKVAEKEASIAQLEHRIALLLEEIDTIRASTSVATQTTTAAAQPREEDKRSTAGWGAEEEKRVQPRAAQSEDGKDGGREAATAHGLLPASDPHPLPVSAASSAADSRDERIRLLQSQLTALRATLQASQQQVEGRQRAALAAKERAEDRLSLSTKCHVVTWLLLVAALLCCTAFVLQFRESVVPAVCDFAFPLISEQAQQQLAASVQLRQQCEMEKDALQLQWEQSHAHHHHHDHHEHTVQYEVQQDCPPQAACPASPRLSCPPSLPLSELEYGSAFSINPEDADASFLLSLSKAELVMSLLREKERAEAGRQWEVTHRISKERWGQERVKHSEETQQLRQRAETAEAQQAAQQPSTPPPPSPADCPPASACDLEPSNAAIAACELRVTELTAAHETATSSLASLQIEHDTAKAAAADCRSEQADAEQRAQQRLAEAVAAEQETAKQRLAESEAQAAQQLAALRTETERMAEQLQAMGNESCDCPSAAAASPASAAAAPLPTETSAPLESADTATTASLPASSESPADSESPSSPSPSAASPVPGSDDTELVSVVLDASGAVLDVGVCERERSEQEKLLASLQPEVQQLRQERDDAVSASSEASTRVALLQSELAALESSHIVLQAAFSALNASVEEERLRLQEEAAEAAADDDALALQASALLELQQERDVLSNRTVELEAATLQLEERSRQAEDRLQELEAASTEAERRLQAATRELGLSRQTVDELRAEHEAMHARYETQLSAAEQEVRASRQRRREEAGTLQLLDLLLAQVQEAESGIASLSALLSELTANSSESMSADDLQALESGLQQLSSSSAAAAGSALAAAQLELVELRLNLSRLSDDNTELNAEVERLQRQVEELKSRPSPPLPSAPVDARGSALPAASSSVPSGLELERLRAQCDEKAHRLQAEADITTRSLRECVAKSAQLRAEMDRMQQQQQQQETSQQLPSPESLLLPPPAAVSPFSFSSPAYLPFLPGIPLPALFASFSSWSPLLKLLLLFSLIAADLLFFQLLLFSRHRAFTSVTAVLYVALSALCVHWQQFVLALFCAANALMALWTVVNPAAALLACRCSCCRAKHDKQRIAPSTALVLSNGKDNSSGSRGAASAPPPPLLNSAGSSSAQHSSLSAAYKQHPSGSAAAGGAGAMPPPPRVPLQPFTPQSPTGSQSFSRPPLPPHSVALPAAPPHATHSSRPPSPSSVSRPALHAPQARRTGVSPFLNDDAQPAVSLPQPPPQLPAPAAGDSPPQASGGRPAFNRAPTSTRMFVMEERQLSRADWIAPGDIARATTFSSRLDISSSPGGHLGHGEMAAAGGVDGMEGGQRGGSMSAAERGGFDTSPASSATPSGRSVTFAESGSPPPALPPDDGSVQPRLSSSPSSRRSSFSSSSSSSASDLPSSFPSFSPPPVAIASLPHNAGHSPFSLPSAHPSFSPPPQSRPSYPDDESSSAYPSELSPRYPASLSVSAAASASASAAPSALPSRRGSLSGASSSSSSMPPPLMPPMPMPMQGRGGGAGAMPGMPMPPRPNMGGSNAAGMSGTGSSYGSRRPAAAMTDDFDFA